MANGSTFIVSPPGLIKRFEQVLLDDELECLLCGDHDAILRSRRETTSPRIGRRYLSQCDAIMYFRQDVLPTAKLESNSFMYFHFGVLVCGTVAIVRPPHWSVGQHIASDPSRCAKEETEREGEDDTMATKEVIEVIKSSEAFSAVPHVFNEHPL